MEGNNHLNIYEKDGQNYVFGDKINKANVMQERINYEKENFGSNDYRYGNSCRVRR